MRTEADTASPASTVRARKLTNAATSGVLADVAGFDEPFRLASVTAGPDFASYNVVGGATQGPDDLTGTPGDDHIAGLGGDDSLHGLAGDDLLDGGTGNDILEGGPGNDIHVVDSASDQVDESAGNGFDVVYAVTSYQLAPGADVERLSWIDWTLATPASLIGNALANLIEGNAGPNLLDGRGGVDRMVGFGGDDIYIVDNPGDAAVEKSGGGRDVVYALTSYQLAPGSDIERLSWIDWTQTTAASLTGNELPNLIEGNFGANFLDGRGGADRMLGFRGDDIYIVDNVGDQVVEPAQIGYDTVYTLISYTLTPNVERLSWIDKTQNIAATLTGNVLANVIEGNAGANILDGGVGADRMVGFGSDDIYHVDNGNDQITEVSGEGYDTVFTDVSYRLAPGSSIEEMRLDIFSDGGRLTGNELSNRLHGSNGNDVLDGGGGADMLFGSAGNDEYVIDDPGDRIEGEGPFTSEFSVDRVSTLIDFQLEDDEPIEILRAKDQQSLNPLSLIGNNLNNPISGNDGPNVLDGKHGQDSLSGFGGADRFTFSADLGPPGDRSAYFDIIVDYEAGIDTIALDHTAFVGLSVGPLPASAFATGGAAADADDRIIYERPSSGTTGVLRFDADGNGPGAALFFAFVNGAPALTAADFIVI